MGLELSRKSTGFVYGLIVASVWPWPSRLYTNGGRRRWDSSQPPSGSRRCSGIQGVGASRICGSNRSSADRVYKSVLPPPPGALLVTSWSWHPADSGKPSSG